MNLNDLETNFNLAGDLVREIFRDERINSDLRQSYWQTQLVICSVLLKGNPFEHFKSLITRVNRGMLSADEVRDEYSQTFSAENINVNALSEDARLTYSESLLTGKGGVSCFLILTMQTLTHAQATVTNVEELKRVNLAFNSIQSHYDAILRKKAGYRTT